jgi:catalase
MTGFTTFQTADGQSEQGDKLRIRPASFADHYSQARLFFRSLDPHEQAHLASAIVFELSKVGIEAVRTRMMSNLVNVDPDLAKRVGAGLNMPVPKASKTAVPVQDLDLSPALRIVNGPRAPTDIKGHVIGILSPTARTPAVDKLKAAIKKAGAVAKVIAPKIGGAKGADGTLIPADGQLAGTPSVTVDAIALVLSEDRLRGAAEGGRGRPVRHGRLRSPEGDRRDRRGQAAAGQGRGRAGRGCRRVWAPTSSRRRRKRFWDREPKVRTRLTPMHPGRPGTIRDRNKLRACGGPGSARFALGRGDKICRKELSARSRGPPQVMVVVCQLLQALALWSCSPLCGLS